MHVVYLLWYTNASLFKEVELDNEVLNAKFIFISIHKRLEMDVFCSRSESEINSVNCPVTLSSLIISGRLGKRGTMCLKVQEQYFL